MTTTSSTPNAADLERGDKVITYALRLLSWGVTIAVAWSCSSVIMGIIMFIVMALLMALLSAVAYMFISLNVPTTSIETLGRTVGGVTGRVSGLFTRKEPAHA